jgi:hypothetical protein
MARFALGSVAAPNCRRVVSELVLENKAEFALAAKHNFRRVPIQLDGVALTSARLRQ